MNREGHSRSALLLTETLIALIFFSLISAMCLQLFSKSHTLSSDARAITMAAAEGESIITLIRRNPSRRTDEIAAGLIPYREGIALSDTCVCIGYDKELTVCDQKEAVYLLSVTPAKPEDESIPGVFSYTLYLTRTGKMSPCFRQNSAPLP